MRFSPTARRPKDQWVGYGTSTHTVRARSCISLSCDRSGCAVSSQETLVRNVPWSPARSLCCRHRRLYSWTRHVMSVARNVPDDRAQTACENTECRPHLHKGANLIQSAFIQRIWRDDARRGAVETRAGLARRQSRMKEAPRGGHCTTRHAVPATFILVRVTAVYQMRRDYPLRQVTRHHGWSGSGPCRGRVRCD